MRLEWTPAAIRALHAVRGVASQRTEPISASGFILLALVEEAEGRAARVFSGAGLDAAAARRAVEQFLAASPAPCAIEPIEELARQIACTSSTDGMIGSEQLLLAALQLDAGLRQALEQAGLASERLEALVAASTSILPLDEPLDLGEPLEAVDTARIIDVNANRAREALRVVEDHCRFVLNDAFLCREWKSQRHELAEALSVLPGGLLLSARDSLGDVGADVSTTTEWQRLSLQHVAEANLKRLQEALRSIEEHGKVLRPDFARRIERLRYRTYTLERAMLLGGVARQRLHDVRLCALLTASQCAASLDFMIAEAASGGVGMFQLREKTLHDRELLDRARKVRRWTQEAGVLFIVNDRPDIARLVNADGVHLGQDDMSVAEARRLAGSDALIGVSTHNLEQLRRAVLDGASYVGVGPVFPSETKSFEQLAGLGFVTAAFQETTLPAFAIGGVTMENVDQVVRAGATRIAVSSAICRAAEPAPVARRLRQALTIVNT